MRRVFAIITVYGLLAVLALHQPVLNAATHMTGSIVTDYYHFNWNYWWIRHALTNGLDIYQTNYIFAPAASSLAFHTLAPFWYPVWALVEPLADTIPAMTVIFWLAFTLTGCAFYRLLRREGVAPGWALVGGAMLELCPMLFSAAYWSMTSLLGWFWLPLLLHIWGEVTRANTAVQFRRALLWSLLLGLSFWAMMLTDLQYPIFAAFLLVPYGLLTLWRTAGWPSRSRLVTFGLFAVFIGTVLLWFAGPLRPILNYDTAGLSPTPVERAVSLTFPDEFLWHVTEPDAVGKNVSLGAVALPLLLIAFIFYLRLPHTRRAAGFWLAVSLPPLILAAGGSITLGGTSIPLPYTVLHTLFGGMLRYPERFAPVFLIPAALFSFRILTLYMANRLNPRLALTSALLFLVLADSRLYASVAIQPQPRDYAFYHQMGHELYDYVVLEVPTGGSSGEGLVGETSYSALEFYGITHGKRMVNGHISRVNVLRYWYMRTDDAMLAWLGQRRFLEPETVEAQLRERIFKWPIGYIVIHQDLIGRNGPTNQEIVGYFNTLPDLLCPVWVEAEAVVYRTAWHPDGCPPRTPPETELGVYTINIGSTGDERFIGWGWHWPEQVAGLTLRWTGEYPQTQIYVDLPPADYDLTLAAQSFWENRRLTVLVNGQPVSEPITVTPDSLHEFTFTIPADLIGDGQHITITLNYDAVIVPAEVGQSADPRRLALAVDWLRFTRLPSPP